MKKLLKSISIILMVFFIVFIMSSCSKENVIYTKSDSLNVTKVENISDDFIFGMDISSVISLENAGVKYYDFEGNENDIFETLSKSGINYIRVRIWNNPYDEYGRGFGGGNNDINTAVEIGKRATKYGMKLLVDFHYSDFWADPQKQMVPNDWKTLSFPEKSQALYEYTKDCLNKLKSAEVDVGMVQIGNETNSWICGETDWKNICTLFESGSKAVREVFPNSYVVLHFSNPEKVTNYEEYASMLDLYKVDYDIFASSYYPFWHGTFENLSNVLSKVVKKYNKKVIIAETSYPFTKKDSDYFGNTITSGYENQKYPYTIQGQADFVRDLIDTAVNKIKNCLGVFYWEGAWISVGGSSWKENSILWEKYGCGWASSYASVYDPNDAGKYYGGSVVDNQAFFDAKGYPLESLKIFNLVKYGNVALDK